jgi:broad specificity phosphatase PhoE
VFVALLRHTETETSDVYPTDQQTILSAAGREAAVALQPAVAAYAPDQVWRSELRRAAQTWNLAGARTALRPRVHPGLNERHFRSLEGLTRAEIAARVGTEQTEVARRAPELFDPPGEESIDEARVRLVAATTEIVQEAAVHAARRILIVTHGGPSSWLLCHLLNRPLVENRMFRHDQGRFHLIAVDADLELLQIAALNSADLPGPGGLALTRPGRANDHLSAPGEVLS